MTFFESLGVRSIVNAATSFTVLGGSRMPPEVLDAMRDAAGSFVDMHEVHHAVGVELAELTRNEAAYVTAGCAAAIAIGVLACRTRGVLARIASLPDGDSLPDEIIMHTAHRNPYDPAVLLAGAKIRTIGNVRQTFAWELEAALGPRTAAVLYVAGPNWRFGALPLVEVVQIAHAAGVPVIVDAAAQLPPVENLWQFTTIEGADLAVFSGGKELRGPQASGLMLGRAELVEAARLNGAPHQRLARAMKVGKEEVAGLLAAVRRYMTIDHASELQRWLAICRWWLQELDDLPGINCSVELRNSAGAELPRVRVEVDSRLVGRSTAAIVSALRARTPSVAVGSGSGTTLFLEPALLNDGEEQMVLDSLAAELSAGSDTNPCGIQGSLQSDTSRTP